MAKYLIDNDSWFKEGGCCQLYPIAKYNNIGFKEFSSKQKASYARNIQLKLSKFNLAPKVLSKIRKLRYSKSICGWVPESSNWGYITELGKHGKVSYSQVQDLVDNIFKTTKLKFWDCHYSNIAYIKRNGKLKAVCIDTGKESFDGYCNAWGFSDPGPKCNYCYKFQCKCSEY
jgi:hypothetical protein